MASRHSREKKKVPRWQQKGIKIARWFFKSHPRDPDVLMATVYVPPAVSPWDAPLAASCPRASSFGTRRGTGLAETDLGPGDAPSSKSPLRGCWLLKRSEHLKRWNKRWVSLDVDGTRVEFCASPGDKPLSHIALADIRAVSVSSVNFHGNKSYANRCVFLETSVADPESDAWKGVFLVAETETDAGRWVCAIRALALDPAWCVTDDRPSLSPAAAPPTPALLPSVPRSAPTSVSSASVSSNSVDSTRSVSSFAGDATTPNSASSRSGASPINAASVSQQARKESTTSRSSGAYGSSASTKQTGPKNSSRFAGAKTKTAYAAESASATTEFTRASSQKQTQMREMQDMARAAMDAKDAELVSLNEQLKTATRVVSEARARADSLFQNLDEKTLEVVSLTRELEDFRAAYASAADLARARLSNADTTERELRQMLLAAEINVREVILEKQTAAAAATKEKNELRFDLEAAGARAIRSLNEATTALEAERENVQTLSKENKQLQQSRGWRGVFGLGRGTGGNVLGSSGTRERRRGGSEARLSRTHSENSDSPFSIQGRVATGATETNTTPLLSSGGERNLPHGGVSLETQSQRRSLPSTAAAAARAASTPEAAATARRRLFQHGLAPPTPMEVIGDLDSPGVHGCRQM